MRIAWLVYGDLTQTTGGYIYDRLVVEGLRAGGDVVELFDPRALGSVPSAVEVVVGDALCARELAPLFEGAPSAIGRVLLVHHLESWERERRSPEGDLRTLVATEERALAASDRVVATGPRTLERLIAAHASVPTELVVPGADRLPRLARASKRAGRIELLFVGNLTARKRLMSLLDAFDQVGDPALALTIIGDATREPRYAREVSRRIDRSLLLRAQVTVGGQVADDTLARAMASADALVLPSSLEGYGMVLSEALRAGLPVLASRSAASAADLVDHGAVRVFDENVALAATLRRFAGDTALRAMMERAASRAQLPRWVDTIAAFGRALVRSRRWP